ncbi:hypothetical protein AGOR_G00131780 [Albula goreensis]|uniref:Uncharacterized protein n=1 Tax=Albula goreensis TaxID=1534307 RepID=A0A8T3D7L6_9TELE|nr:hypothetical protein AGOR_G00131780 [Albula goreensis]
MTTGKLPTRARARFAIVYFGARINASRRGEKRAALNTEEAGHTDTKPFRGETKGIWFLRGCRQGDSRATVHILMTCESHGCLD